MKVALIIERFNPAGGGAERSTAQMAHELVKAGHEVTILTGSATTADGDKSESLAYQVESLGLQGRFGAFKLWQFARWSKSQAQQSRFDVSLSVTTTVPASVVQPRSGTLRETFQRNIAMRPCAWQRALKRLTMMLSMKHHLLLRLERKTLGDSSVKRFAAVSGYGRDQLIRYGIDPSRIAIIPNAAWMPQVSQQERQLWRQQTRHEFAVGDDALVYLFAALNPKLKGVQTLLEATKLLNQQGLKNFVVLVVGRSDQWLQRQVDRLNIADQVRVIAPTQQIARLYCTADITVLPTFYDPSSKVVIESLMMGVPAISTRFNGASDFILAGQAKSRGRVIDNPADAHALAQAMLELADADTRLQCATQTDGLAQELSMQAHVQKLMKLLEEAKRER